MARQLLQYEAATGIFHDIIGSYDETTNASALDITYNNANYPTVKDALDSLLYVSPKINSFSLSVGTVEIGSVVTTVTANWSFNKPMTTASLTDATIAPTDTSYAFTGLNLTSDKTYILGCSDGTNSVTSSKKIHFSHKRYWGTSINTTLSDAEILALSSEFSSSKSKSVTYDCTGGKYPYFVFLASLGNPSVTVNGLPMTDLVIVDQNFTNASGHTDTFKVIRFTNLINGIISAVWS